MVDLKKLANELVTAGKAAEGSFPFEVNPIPGEVEVLQIIVEDRQELPIFVSASEEQILCIAYLFKEDEVNAENITDVNKAMLSANISNLNVFVTVSACLDIKLTFPFVVIPETVVP